MSHRMLAELISHITLCISAMTKRKKKTVFQVPAPRPSILGLDKLAAEKRKQQKEERKSRVTSYKDDADAGDDVESDVTPSRHGAAKPPRDR